MQFWNLSSKPLLKHFTHIMYWNKQIESKTFTKELCLCVAWTVYHFPEWSLFPMSKYKLTIQTGFSGALTSSVASFSQANNICNLGSTLDILLQWRPHCMHFLFETSRQQARVSDSQRESKLSVNSRPLTAPLSPCIANLSIQSFGTKQKHWIPTSSYWHKEYFIFVTVTRYIRSVIRE